MYHNVKFYYNKYYPKRVVIVYMLLKSTNKNKFKNKLNKLISMIRGLQQIIFDRNKIKIHLHKKNEAPKVIELEKPLNSLNIIKTR